MIRPRWIASLTAAKQIAEARGRVDLVIACELKIAAVKWAPDYELHAYQPGVDMLVADATTCAPLSVLRARRAAETVPLQPHSEGSCGMSMSANFHNIAKVELDTLFVSSLARSHPMLKLSDADGCYVAAHLTPSNVDQLEVALAAYREAHPRIDQQEAA